MVLSGDKCGEDNYLHNYKVLMDPIKIIKKEAEDDTYPECTSKLHMTVFYILIKVVTHYLIFKRVWKSGESQIISFLSVDCLTSWLCAETQSFSLKVFESPNGMISPIFFKHVWRLRNEIVAELKVEWSVTELYWYQSECEWQDFELWLSQWKGKVRYKKDASL